MKYIRKARNTNMANKPFQDFITEIVDESLFTEEHARLGGWELVSDEQAAILLQLSLQDTPPEPVILTEEQKLKRKEMILKRRAQWQE